MESKSDIIKDAFRMLEKVNVKVSQEFEVLLNHELSPKQELVLKTVRDAEKITINALSEITGFSPSSLSQLVSRMEEAGYLKREINLNNRREIFVMLGENGSQYVKDYDEVDNEIIKKYYVEFSVEEVQLFRSLVRKLFHATGFNDK